MQFIAYILAYPFIWLFSKLPFPLLYLLSDFVYVILYRVIGYRKATVRLNLSLALPHLTTAERKTIEKKFYHHFCDSFFEMAKTLTISDEQINKRFVFTNFEVVRELEKQQKSVAMLLGHYGSYEWMLVMNRHLSLKGYGIYKPIKNKYFDRLVKKMRSRFNAELVGIRDVIPTMRNNIRNNVHGVYGFITDQSPKLSSAIHWGEFFDMEVPIHVGGELLAKKIGLNMIFAKIEKTGRGYYKCTFIPVEENIKDVPNFDISDRFMHMLEEQIKEVPPYYLWTHKRFKHRRNDPPAIK